MKKISLLLCLLFTTIIVGCEEAGTSSQIIGGNENKLPKELQGLKVYEVATGSGSYVKVAILNNEINSTTYPVGKQVQSTIIVKGNQKFIMIEDVLYEISYSNDGDFIICKKVKLD